MSKKIYRSLRQIFESGRSHIGREGDLFSTSKLNDAESHFCIYEDGDALDLPTVVVPSVNNLENFFADIATYFSDYAPITAYVHVVDESSFRLLQNSSKALRRKVENRRELLAYIGLIVGDSLSTVRAVNNRSTSLSYTSCKRTLSYCIARSAVLHPSLSTHEVSRRWLRIRELSGMDASKLTADSISWAADVINGKYLNSNVQELRNLTETLYIHFQKKSTQEQIRECLVALYPELRKVALISHAAYEKRIDVFSSIVKAVQQNSIGVGLDSLCVAFFCNSILPGSLAHSGLLEKLLPVLPDSLLWYGLFAASSDEFSLASLAKGIGQKLLRDIVAPFDFSSRPTCDLSLDEYDVLARAPLRSDLIKPTQAKAVLISLYPGVEVYVRSVMEEEEGFDKHSRFLLEQDERAVQVRHLLLQADQLLSGEKINEPTVRSRLKTTVKPRQTRI